MSNLSWWMIERHDLGPIHYFHWSIVPRSADHRYGRHRGTHDWTPDWQRGERFPSEEAARKHTNDDPNLRVCEHAIMESPMTPTPSTGDGLIERFRELGRPSVPPHPQECALVLKSSLRAAADTIQTLQTERDAAAKAGVFGAEIIRMLVAQLATFGVEPACNAPLAIERLATLKDRPNTAKDG